MRSLRPLLEAGGASSLLAAAGIVSGDDVGIGIAPSSASRKFSKAAGFANTATAPEAIA
jgi:hypothetical protein